MVEQEAEAGVAELVAVTLQVVAAKLVDHDHDDQLGAAVIGRGEARTGKKRKEENQAQDGSQALARRSGGRWHRKA